MNQLTNIVKPLEFMLFETSTENVKDALDYGLNTFLIDWEDKGKYERQYGYDTQILTGTRNDLYNLSSISGTKTWCRINRFGNWTKDEVNSAIESGATGLFLPMVTNKEEVETFLDYINNRCLAGILIETVEAVSIATDLSTLPLERIYFGLNDFTISRKDSHIFESVYDHTVESVKRKLDTNINFGFGGATYINGGYPIPVKKLLQEMHRLECSYTFLRRSFKKDIEKHNPKTVIEGIQKYWARLHLRTNTEKELDRNELSVILEEHANTYR